MAHLDLLSEVYCLELVLLLRPIWLLKHCFSILLRYLLGVSILRKVFLLVLQQQEHLINDQQS